jgi:hypothetical protein
MNTAQVYDQRSTSDGILLIHTESALVVAPVPILKLLQVFQKTRYRQARAEYSGRSQVSITRSRYTFSAAAAASAWLADNKTNGGERYF